MSPFEALRNQGRQADPGAARVPLSLSGRSIVSYTGRCQRPLQDGPRSETLQEPAQGQAAVVQVESLRPSFCSMESTFDFSRPPRPAR